MKPVHAKKQSSSYEVDIGEEFKQIKHDLKTEISTLGGKIQSLEMKFDKFINSFEGRLDILNGNMEKALNTIANHENRLTALEQASKQTEIKKQGLDEFFKKAALIGKLTSYVIIGFAALGGVQWAVSLLNAFIR